MASFTDLIPQFNPYIQQLPVEAMVSVGMEKQKRYDEGLQKIQSQIDQIAGLSVSRPADKMYLQSKINELGNNLKGLAAGDFSNFQLVNSIGGMVGQISKDPYVIAAVKSTANIQENRKRIEADKISGKFGPENEYVYLLGLNKYMNSGLKDQEGNPVVFSGFYKPFKDVYGKLRTIAKDVGVDETIVQNLFNPDGSVNKVMIETVSKGKDANKIYDAFVNGLDQDDYQQLAITGIYKYRNQSPEEIIGVLDASNKQYMEVAQNKRADIETEIADLKQKLPSAKPADAELINKQILSLSGIINKLDENMSTSQTEYATATERILSGDEDYINGIKGKIHTNNFLTSLSRDFSEKTSHVKYSENPLWKAIMEENKFAFDKWYKSQQLDIDRRKAAAAEEANKLTKMGMFPSFGAASGLSTEGLSFPDIVNDQYRNTLNERNGKLITLGRWEMKRLGWSDDKISNWVKTQAKARGTTEDDVIMTFGTQALARIKSGAVQVPSEMVSELENIEYLNNFVSGFEKQIKEADARAKAEGGSEVADVNDIMKNAKPLEVTLRGELLKGGVGAGKVLLSPADQVDLAKVVLNQRDIFSTKGEDSERQVAEQRLRVKFGDSYPLLVRWGGGEAAKNPSFLKKFFLGSPMGAVIDAVRGKETERTPFQQVVTAYQSESFKKYKDAQNKVYGEIFSAYFPQNRAVVLTEKSRPVFDAALTAMFADRPEYTQIKTKLDDPKSQIVVSTVPSITGLSGGSEISLRVIGKGGESTDPILMTRDQYQALFNQSPEEVNPMMAFTRSKINASPDKSTNSNGLGSLPTAFFGSNAFVNLTPATRSRVAGGDFVRDASGRDIYYGKVYYVKPGYSEAVPVDIGAPMTLGEAMAFPTLLTDNKLNNIISNQ